MSAKGNSERKPGSQPVFHKVAENLYRLESSGAYYALVKKGGKQFRRSLRTKDRKLAERRLKEIKDKIGQLSTGEDAKLTFQEVAKNRWLECIRHTLAPATVTQREIRIRNIAPFFGGKPIRNVRAADCEKWVVQRDGKLAPQTFVHELEVMRATVCPSYPKNSTSEASPAPCTSTTVPTSPRFRPVFWQIVCECYSVEFFDPVHCWLGVERKVWVCSVPELLDFKNSCHYSSSAKGGAVGD